jgi:hypothetical protein
MARKRNPRAGATATGADQATALSRLYADDTAPAPAAHPDAQYYPQRLGETVEVRGLPGRYVVVALDDRSLVTLRDSNGAQFRAGWRTIRRVGS